MNARFLVVLAFAACVLGCGSSEPDLPPSAELGSGESTFEALTDGDTLEVIQGPQGGFHVLGSVRVTGIDPGDADNLGSPNNPTTSFRVFRGAERVDANASNYTQGLRSAGGGVYEMIGRFVILDILDESELAGSELRLSVEVVDRDGSLVSDERRVTAVDESP